ncbi:MAG: DUF5947 family protein [Jatrophihabitans sp.]
MSEDPLFVLRRIASRPPPPPAGELCEMCTKPIADEHQHVVDIANRSLMCACRPCYLLFTAQDAQLRYRAVPDRYLVFPDFELGLGQWDQFEIPVGLAFFFTNSTQDRTVAFYPGPAGATESELPLEAWQSVTGEHPELATLMPDVEALLLRTPERGSGDVSCYLVPIDACYELVGQLRSVWRGFDGGGEARALLGAFFARLDQRSKPVRAPEEAAS